MPESTLTAFVNGSAGQQRCDNRVTRFWYDSLQRARFSLDAEGYLVETKYLDSAKSGTDHRLRQQTDDRGDATLAQCGYGNRFAPSRRPGHDADLRCRRPVVQVTDANGKSEYFAYDAVGNKTSSSTRRPRAPTDLAYTWIYEYDAEPAPGFERSPTVSFGTCEYHDAVVTETTAQLVTHNLYDALGNVTAASRVKAPRRHARPVMNTTCWAGRPR